MKRNLIISLCGVAAATAVALTACAGQGIAKPKGMGMNASASSSAAPSYADMEYDAAFSEKVVVEAAAEAIAHTGAPAPGGNSDREANPTAMNSDGSPLDQRKIIRHSSLSLETTDFDGALRQIAELVAANGGYIENQMVDGRSINSRDEYYTRYASLSARVPSEKLDAVTNGVGGICNITNKSESMDDITDRYFDAQAHLDTLKVQEERLLEILRKAEKLEDVVQLEQALSDTRYQIESLTASLRRMDSQVTYSYLNMDLREVVQYKDLPSAPKTFGERLEIAAQRGGSHFVSFFQGLLLLVVEIGPLLLMLAAVIVAVILVAIRLPARGRKRRAAKLAAMHPVSPAKPESQEPEK